MKQYDRETKKWITQEEYDKRYNKHDKDLCKGKRPHNFILILPRFVTYDSKYDFDATKYYEIMEETREFENKQYDRLTRLGIVTMSWRNTHAEAKLFMCSVCKKLKYKYEKDE